MTLSKSKTSILTSGDFVASSSAKYRDSPINDAERHMIEVTGRALKDPYMRKMLHLLESIDRTAFTQEKIESVLEAYLSVKETNYIRLRWLIRRITQVGAPGGIEYISTHLEDFIPAMREVQEYFVSCRKSYGEWPSIGQRLLEFTNNSIFENSDYLQMIVFSLFSEIIELNHSPALLEKYKISNAISKREIIIYATKANLAAWLKTQRSEYQNSQDAWLRRSLLHASKLWGKDERGFRLKGKGAGNFLEGLIILDVE